MEKEYLMLKDEIMLSMKTIKNYNTMLYTVSAALLAFAFNSQNELLFLLPFVILFPLYYLITREAKQALRIGAYMIVFLEEKTNFSWESRLYLYDNTMKNNKHAKVPMVAYFSIGCLCILLSAMYTNYSIIDYYHIALIICQIILLFACVIMFVVKAPNYTKIKEGYVLEWEQIKRHEISIKILE